ncbi:MAG: hypothetical protein M3N37_06450 [Actinomycetota bacterium]|nr:hypothetical protein [Actinomycetota bacterium]
MKRGVVVLGPLLGVAVISACGGGGDADADRVTTTTLSPEAQVAGREVCESLFSDPNTVPSLERARVAGPQLAAIVEELGVVVAEKDRGGLTREQFVARLTTLLPAFEIVCEDDYGVVAPPGFP